jgi:hypothetical protein
MWVFKVETQTLLDFLEAFRRLGEKKLAEYMDRILIRLG